MSRVDPLTGDRTELGPACDEPFFLQFPVAVEPVGDSGAPAGGVLVADLGGSVVAVRGGQPLEEVMLRELVFLGADRRDHVGSDQGPDLG